MIKSQQIVWDTIHKHCVSKPINPHSEVVESIDLPSPFLTCHNILDEFGARTHAFHVESKLHTYLICFRANIYF